MLEIFCKVILATKGGNKTRASQKRCPNGRGNHWNKALKLSHPRHADLQVRDTVDKCHHFQPLKVALNSAACILYHL